MADLLEEDGRLLEAQEGKRLINDARKEIRFHQAAGENWRGRKRRTTETPTARRSTEVLEEMVDQGTG